MHAVIESKPVALWMDTGWADADITIDPDFVPGLVDLPKPIHHLTLGTMQLDSTTISTFDLGGYDGSPKVDGIFGAPLLVKHAAIVDFGHEVLYLHK